MPLVFLFHAHPPPTAFSHFFFFFNDPATTEIYTLSLHDALPISCHQAAGLAKLLHFRTLRHFDANFGQVGEQRSEEHTSELQSRVDLVCRLLLEKKKKKKRTRLRGST